MAPQPKRTVRCAIYTRKSTEYGLEQDFNSLDAQREAAEAYIKSQAHEGWRALPGYYDDGGISGGTLERPALQRLLAEIRERKIDVVVVYKVDRLTRSLGDFAKLVELFDAHDVSFVSVTQQFNTTSSMGRLTLNVLLSFAQFEREVTAERIRDKIAASKQRGIWTGGNVALGYQVKDKKLVVDERAAEQVRFIFRRYLELGSLSALQKDLHERGMVTTTRRLKSGRTIGGIPFYKGPLAWLLKNRTYVGEVNYRGKLSNGQHQAILDRELFDAVQEKLASGTREFKRVRTASDLILIGKLYDDAGNRMTPVSSHKGTIRYRYYQSAPAQNGAKKPLGSVSRVPAPEIEAAVVHTLRSKVEKIESASELDCGSLIATHLDRAVISTDELRVRLRKEPESHSDHDELRISFRIRNVKPERKMIGVEASSAMGEMRSDKRKRLIRTIAKARAWADDLASGRVKDLAHIARREGTCERYIRTTLPLAFLSPDTVKAVVIGTASKNGIAGLTGRLPASWQAQIQLDSWRPEPQ